jgi:DNA-binding XRE family transcriptional regulator
MVTHPNLNKERVRMVRERVARCLKVYRASFDYTQRQMADELGVAISTYNSIEQGTSDFRVSFLEKMEETLKIKIEDVFKEFDLPS